MHVPFQCLFLDFFITLKSNSQFYLKPTNNVSNPLTDHHQWWLINCLLSTHRKAISRFPVRLSILINRVCLIISFVVCMLYWSRMRTAIGKKLFNTQNKNQKRWKVYKFLNGNPRARKISSIRCHFADRSWLSSVSDTELRCAPGHLLFILPAAP